MRYRDLDVWITSDPRGGYRVEVSPFVRYLPVPRPPLEPVAGGLRILVASVAPRDLDRRMGCHEGTLDTEGVLTLHGRNLIRIGGEFNVTWNPVPPNFCALAANQETSYHKEG